MGRPTLALLLLTVGLPLLLTAQTRDRSSSPPAAPARHTIAQLMSPALVSELVELGKHQAIIPEITRRSGTTGVMMLVLSNRQIIVRASARG